MYHPRVVRPDGREQTGRKPPLNGGPSAADEAWITTALLHREHPDRKDFTMQEIVRRAEHVAGPEPLRPAVKHHVSHHAEAQTRPNPGAALPAVRNRPRAGGDDSSGLATRDTRTARTAVAGKSRRRSGYCPKYRPWVDWYHSGSDENRFSGPEWQESQSRLQRKGVTQTTLASRG